MRRCHTPAPHWIKKEKFPKYLKKYLETLSIPMPEKLIWKPASLDFYGRTWFYIGEGINETVYADELKKLYQ